MNIGPINLAHRKTEQFRSLFGPLTPETKALVVTSSSDEGVCRNGGRRGASFAPAAILSCLGKMALPHTGELPPLALLEAADPGEERRDFSQAQHTQARRLGLALTQSSPGALVHLGGGHDHVYPFLQALGEQFQHLVVVNIDAHLDTRTDTAGHSGTPFRQFASHYQGQLDLFQWGIHEASNPPSNYTSLPRGRMTVTSFEELAQASHNFSLSLTDWALHRLAPLIGPHTGVLLSLDCDAIESQAMEGVSAVNPEGLPLHAVRELFMAARLLREQCPVHLGLYEYNPLYDNLSQKGAKALARLIYQFLLRHPHISS